jgi:hypothetical protein
MSIVRTMDKMQCQSAEMRDFVCMFVFDHEMVRCFRRVLLHVPHARRYKEKIRRRARLVAYSKRLSLRNQQIEITRWTFARFPYAGQKSAG